MKMAFDVLAGVPDIYWGNAEGEILGVEGDKIVSKRVEVKKSQKISLGMWYSVVMEGGVWDNRHTVDVLEKIKGWNGDLKELFGRYGVSIFGMCEDFML